MQKNIDPHHLLVQVAEILDDLKVPYFITGGISVLVWGRPRFTADIDVVVALKPGNIVDLEKAIRKVSPNGYIDRDAMIEALKQCGEFNFIEPDSGIKVDFWILSDSEFDKSRLKRRTKKKILDKNVFFTSAEDLILIKLKWFKESESDRQRADIESILKITKQIDFSYLRTMAQKMNLLKVLEGILSDMSG